MSDQELEQLKTKTIPIFKKYGVLRAGVFGSFARGETTKNSDIDFLVKFSRGTTLFDLGGLKIDLEQQLAKEVDVVSVGGVKKRFQNNIEDDLIYLYEKK